MLPLTLVKPDRELCGIFSEHIYVFTTASLYKILHNFCGVSAHPTDKSRKKGAKCAGPVHTMRKADVKSITHFGYFNCTHERWRSSKQLL